MKNDNTHSVAIVDDHVLFAGSLESLINTFPDYQVMFLAKNGIDLQHKLKLEEHSPEIILLDLNMPVMDGIETMEWLTKNQPDIKVLALSMDDHELSILKMLRRGAKGYLLKDIHPEKLKVALNEVVSRGYYHSEQVTNTLLNSLNTKEKEAHPSFKENEIIFIKLACTEMTYKEIADAMNLSPKTIDGYRNDLFRRLNIKNRVGLVIYALKHDLVKV
jgi:Response regulator containing a CheY-like receiver domain and an HTH DNA-binding domain